MSLSLDVEYGVLAKQNLGNGYVNAIKLSSNLEKIVSAINDISSAVKTNIVVRSVNDQLPQNETNDINLNILRPDKNETDVYKEILSSASQFMQESSEVSFQATEIGKKELQAGKNKIQSILVDDNKILAGSSGDGIFYSEDNGETFEQATGLESQSVKVIKKFFGKYFAGTGNSVYQSTDGKNWTIFTVKVSKNIYQIKESVNDLLQVKYGNRKILIVATDNGVVATTNSYAKKTLISGTAYALTKDDKDNVYFSANFSDNAYIYVISIEKINNYLTATDVKKTTEENSEIPNLARFKFGSNVYDILIKDKTLFAAVQYTVEDNSRIRSITTKYGIKKAPLSDLSQQSFTSIQGIGQQISYLKTNGYGIYTQIKNGNYPTFWFTTNGQDFTSYKTKLNDDISEFDFIDNFTMVAGANGGIIKFKQTADYIRDKLITEIDLLANNEQLCTYINEQDYNTCSSANKYTDDEISALDKDISDRISSEIDYIKNNTLSSYEQISTFTQDYISLGKNTYDNDANKLSNNVAIGKDVVVTSIIGNSIGLGQNISASGSNNIAIGNNLSTSNTNAIAIGYNITSDPNAGEHSIAIGYDAVALCEDSIAIGRMISTETSSTTKIGAAFRDESESYNNAETIALELFAKIGDDASATSESKAYITTNRFTENTGTWTETKKEISLEGHKHLLADITDSNEKFSQYDEQINYISTYVSAIPDNVEKISVDLYSLSSQTKSISTQLGNSVTALRNDIYSQKVTVFSDLSAYTKDGLSSSDTVMFPTAAAITQWADNRYLQLAGFNDPSEVIGLLSSMLQKSDLHLYCSDTGNDENDGSVGKPVKTITKAILLANKRRFISGSQIYIHLNGEFNIREEAAKYIDKDDKGNYDIHHISDTNTKFHNDYGLNIHHPDMIAPSYLRINNEYTDDGIHFYEANAKIVANLSSTHKWQIAIKLYCDTIFKNIQFDGGVPHNIYDPNILLNISSISTDFDNDVKSNANIIEPKYSKISSAYTKNDINESFLLGSFSDYVDYYNCSCYNFMTAFNAPNLVKNCYFENGYRCIETNKANRTEIQGLSGYNIYSVSQFWLNGIGYLANAEEDQTLNFRNLREFVTPTNTGFNILFNLYFSYVGYYNKDTLRLEDSVDGKPVNRITDNYNIYKYCSSYVYNKNNKDISVGVTHTTVDYIDFVNTFIYGQPPTGGDISAKYQNFRNKYGGILTFACGDYATSSIIYVPLSVVDSENYKTSDKYICYFPFLEQLFNIIREDDKTITSQYNGTQYSTTYHAYKLSDIVSSTIDNKGVSSLSIDYTKFTISADKYLFDCIY